MNIKLNIECETKFAGFLGMFQADRFYETDEVSRKETIDRLTDETMGILSKTQNAAITFLAYYNTRKTVCMGRIFTLYDEGKMTAIIWPEAFIRGSDEKEELKLDRNRREVRKIIERIYGMYEKAQAMMF